MGDERRFYLNLFHGICHDEYTRVLQDWLWLNGDRSGMAAL